MFFKNRQDDIKKLDDESLIARYKQTGENRFVGELFDRYTHLGFLVCMKYLKDDQEAKDAVMQVFEKLLVDLKKYEVRKFKHWLHRVLRNHCLVILEKRQREQQKSENYRQTEGVFMESGQNDYHNNETDIKELRLTQLESALELLNEQQKKCVELFYLQQKCYQEVAEITGFEMKKVKSYIQNGKRNLKIHLSKLMIDE